MKQLLTKDGSITFFNEQYQDVYNSTSGAMEEALEKFVKPTKVADLAKKGKVRVLDVCFGIGYNTLQTLEEVKDHQNLEIIGLENDQEVFDQILVMEFKEKNYEEIKKAVKEKSKIIKLIKGDARKTINEVPGLFDVVFLDPFTPRTCPELWEENFIKDIAKKMKPGAVIATYSCARIVRDNLKKAGLTVYEGPRVGRMAPSTYAIKEV